MQRGKLRDAMDLQTSAPPPPDDVAANVAWLRDRTLIADLYDRYAYGVDSLDISLVRSVFHPDCVIVGTMEQGSLDDYLEGLELGLAMYHATMHFKGNQYIALDGDRAFVETWVDYTADGIPGITWAPSHYLQYAENVGFDDAMSLTEFCAQAISGCCVENWNKYAEALGTSAVAPPTAEFCENSPCVETYLKYSEGLGSEFAVPFLDFVEAGLCTGSCVENYLRYAEATATNGNPSIIAIAEARACEGTCIENYLKYAEAVGIGGAETLPLITWAAANCGEVE